MTGASVFVVYAGLGGTFLAVDVPAPARIADVYKGLRATFQLSGPRLAATELRLVAAAGPQPTAAAISAALAGDCAALDVSAPLGSAAAGFGAGAWLVAVARPVVVASSLAGAAAGPRYVRSVTEMVGPIFEDEARKALEVVLPEAFPWLRAHSRIISRQLELADDMTREADLLCYASEDTLLPCINLPAHGLRVVALGDGVAEPPREALPIPAALGFSPADGARSGPHKYVLGEAYSGAKLERMEDKVAQLDALVGFTVRRWNDRHPDYPAEDVTQLVGAGALLFCAGAQVRKQALNSATALVARLVGGAEGGAGFPNLRRLARAGRLVVMVLEKAQCPLAMGQRAVAEQLQGLVSIPEDMQAVEGMVAALRDEMAAGFRSLQTGGGGGP